MRSAATNKRVRMVQIYQVDIRYLGLSFALREPRFYQGLRLRFYDRQRLRRGPLWLPLALVCKEPHLTSGLGLARVAADKANRNEGCHTCYQGEAWLSYLILFHSQSFLLTRLELYCARISTATRPLSFKTVLSSVLSASSYLAKQGVICWWFDVESCELLFLSSFFLFETDVKVYSSGYFGI